MKIIDKYDIEEGNGYIIIRIKSEKLDLFETPDVLAGVEMNLKDRNYPNCLVDLAGTSVIDSTGIGFLIAVNNMLLKNGAKMVITGISERVAEIFRITKMGSFFKSVPTVTEAEALFGRTVQ